MEDADLRLEFHRALDEIATAAPWLGDRVRQEMRRQQSVGARRVRTSTWLKPVLGPRTRQVLAAVLVMLVGVTAIGVSLAIVRYAHQTVPVRPPVPGPRLVPCLGQCDVAPQKAATPKEARQCPAVSYTIWPNTPLFATPTLGWIGGWNYGGASRYACLYRTDDGGDSWRPVLSWDGDLGAEQIRSSADGAEALIVSSGSDHTTLFHTSDDGVRWTSNGLPTGADSGSAIFFLNPNEGWVLTAGRDLLHTIDAGAHWRLIGRLGVTGIFQDSLYFLNSSIGWYLPAEVSPAAPPIIYVTHDGGLTWADRVLQQPGDLQPGIANVGNAIKFFDNRDGVLDATYCPSLMAESVGQVYTCGSSMSDYVYVTRDGGDHWSDPTRQPGARNVYIDMNHWIGVRLQASCATLPCPLRLVDIPIQGLLRTGDGGRHWESLFSSPGQYWSGNQLDGMDFVDPSHGWAIVAGNLLTTSDGGTSWSHRTLPGIWF